MNIVLIGGGTGSTVVLNGLKKHKDLKLKVIVSMMDDGGSNAVVRDEFGLLPLSDVRKSIIALADTQSNEVLRNLFTYRFHDSRSMEGHTLGNLLMIAMTDIMGSEVGAIEMFKNMFSVRGDIIPVTLDSVRLVAEYDDGSKVVGEHYIDEPENHKEITKFYLDSKAKAFETALKAIRTADYILLGPGDIYTTLLPNLLVDDITEEIKKSRGKLVYITNLMSKIGQTRNKTQREILDILEGYIGRKVDYVLVNNGRIPEEAYRRYLEDGEHILQDDLHDGDGRLIIRKDLVASSPIEKQKGDHLKRSLIRHDSEKLRKQLYAIFNRDKNGISRILNTFFSYYKD
ncbi:MAG TPA: YvcK family protein [Candidatus Dojkabacteria bacterium]|nr:YvcK family protein [Candidatus Dojkabacteria bacterium]